MSINNLTVALYEAYSTTQRIEAVQVLRHAKVESFTTIYPSGLYLAASIFLPVDVTVPFSGQGGDRVVIRNGIETVWEGALANIGYSIGSQADQGILLECIGYWGWLLGTTTLNKRWADNRISQDVWRIDSGSVETGTVDRQDRIRITPKAETWADTDTYRLTYTMPTGETIKRVTCDVDFAEGAQAWEARLRDTVGAANIWSFTADNTSSEDDTLGTPRQALSFDLVSRASQTPTWDGTYYAEISIPVMYSETGDIDLTAIAGDVVGAVSNMNSGTDYIEDNSLSIVPFFTTMPEACSSILNRAAAFGDGSFNQWACMVIASDEAGTPDGKPVLKVEQYPVLTDNDYAVRVDEDNLVPPLDLVRDFDSVVNWVSVRYRDDENDRDVILTPDDDANLTDSISSAAYGERHLRTPLNAGHSDSGTATTLGRRYLAQYKDPRWFVTGPIVVKGYIRGKLGQHIPASEIRAGMRIKVENFLEDLSATADAGLTFIVTQTRYNDETETCEISTGIPDSLPVFLARGVLSGGLENTTAVSTGDLF